MAFTVGNIKVEPCRVYFGEDVAQVATITCRADASGDLNNDYFFLYTPAGVKHYFWFNVNSGGTDPAIAGATANEVAVATNASAAAVASALEAVIEAVSGFDSTVSGSVITVTNTATGYAQGPHEGVGTGFTFAITTRGNLESEIGYTDGDIELTITQEVVDVTAHQRGTSILSHITTGKNHQVALTLKETTKAQIDRMLRGVGASFTPNGATATEVTGIGFEKDFEQTLLEAGKLRLHPVVLPEGNLSRDVTFWKAYPMLETLTFSGENIFTLPVSFMIYPDSSKRDEVSHMVYGDSSQTMT